MGLWEDANAKYERRRYEEQRLKQAQQLAQEIDGNPLHEHRYMVKVDDEASGWLQQFVQFMRQSGTLPTPCVIPVVGELQKRWFTRNVQIIRAVDAQFSGWPIADKYQNFGYLHAGFAVTDQAKLVCALSATRNELLSENEAERGHLVCYSGIMKIRYSEGEVFDPKVRFWWQIERNNLTTMLILEGISYPYRSQIRDFRDAERFLSYKGQGLGDVLYTISHPTFTDDLSPPDENFLLKDLLTDAVLRVREGRW